MQITGEFNRFHVRVETQIYATIYHGREKFCKTEADAREAAELLKQFFEAKAAGKVARLVVDEKRVCTDCPSKYKCSIEGDCIHSQRPKNTVIDEMNDDAANYQPCLNCKNPIYCQWGKKCSPGNTADSIADRIWGNRAHDMTLEQYEAFTIAHNAALIFAHNTHDFDERRAVQSAAKILNHAQEGQSECNGNCGMNYCDDNGCIERKRSLTNIPSMP